MNVKQIICVAKMFVITSRTMCCFPPRKRVANLHDNRKSNMAAIVNKVYCWSLRNDHSYTAKKQSFQNTTVHVVQYW